MLLRSLGSSLHRECYCILITLSYSGVWGIIIHGRETSKKNNKKNVTETILSSLFHSILTRKQTNREKRTQIVSDHSIPVVHSSPVHSTVCTHPHTVKKRVACILRIGCNLTNFTDHKTPKITCTDGKTVVGHKL